MNDFELQLRAALQRQAPSPDFAAKVLARAKAMDDRRRTSWRPWAAASCIAASLLTGFWSVTEFRHRQERERGQMAHAQLIQALDIASSKLQRIQKKLDGLNHE